MDSRVEIGGKSGRVLTPLDCLIGIKSIGFDWGSGVFEYFPRKCVYHLFFTLFSLRPSKNLAIEVHCGPSSRNFSASN